MNTPITETVLNICQSKVKVCDLDASNLEISKNVVMEKSLISREHRVVQFEDYEEEIKTKRKRVTKKSSSKKKARKRPEYIHTRSGRLSYPILTIYEEEGV